MEPRVHFYLKISSTRSVIYPDFSEFSSRRGQNEKSRENLGNVSEKVGMSWATRKRICDVVYTWFHALQAINYRADAGFESIRKRITFVTLTLPSRQLHDDREIKRKCLMPFIQVMKRSGLIKTYLWVQEVQKNGNIHFHLLNDGYIHHRKLRETWNKHINSLGYVDEFEKKHSHRDPNSTDIHSLKNIKNPSAYITKYFTKNEFIRVQNGVLWNCSKVLKGLKPFVCYVTNREGNAILNYAERENIKIHTTDYAHCFQPKGNFITEGLPSEIRQEMINYYAELGSILMH